MSEPSSSKAIPSLAKRQTDVTRQGNKPLKFVPTLQPRKKKEPSQPKSEPVVHDVPATPIRGRGRGRGRGGTASTRPQQQEMVASGPFALGPSLAGASNRRGGAPSRAAPTAIAPSGPIPGASLIKREPIHNELHKGKEKEREDPDHEIYSDPEDGVEIIDMDRVGEIDWMAPESLKKERKQKRQKGKIKIKTEDRPGKAEEEVVDLEEAAATGEVDLANALNLSESEEEEELEDIIDDFAYQTTVEDAADIQQDRLYLFQFPKPFPIFKRPEGLEVDASTKQPETCKKSVAFTPDTKGDASEASREGETKSPAIGGLVGNLEIYRSGAVKMRFPNGILLDVTAATQPSFLQQAVHLDMETKQLNVLGEVNRRFVVSPDVDLLLRAMEESEQQEKHPVEEGADLITMDVDEH